jgi:hypothetical protein
MMLRPPLARVEGRPADFGAANAHLLLEPDPHMLADPDHVLSVQCSPFSLDQDAFAFADPHRGGVNLSDQGA